MKISSLARLSYSQWLNLLRAWWQLWRVQWVLRVQRSRDVSEWLPRENQGASGSDTKELALAKSLHESVRLAARAHPTRADCLPRSLVLVSLLQRQNVAAQLRLGVSRSDRGGKPTLASHAWVEVNGEAICEPEDVAQRFSLVDVVPPGL